MQTTHHIHNDTLWKRARVSYETAIEHNLVSHPFVYGVLLRAADVQTLNSEDYITSVMVQGCSVQIEGTIRLLWTFRVPGKSFTSTFLVTAAEDSNFDVIIGKKSILDLEIPVPDIAPSQNANSNERDRDKKRAWYTKYFSRRVK